MDFTVNWVQKQVLGFVSIMVHYFFKKKKKEEEIGRSLMFENCHAQVQKTYL